MNSSTARWRSADWTPLLSARVGWATRNTLRKSQVVTVEPGLYDPRRDGVRIEDTILIKGRRINNLTPLEKELEI